MTVPYQNAKLIAKKVDANIDIYFEYPDAYVFSNSKAKGGDAQDNEVVIDKASGKILDYSLYIMNTKYWNKEVQAKLVI